MPFTDHDAALVVSGAQLITRMAFKVTDEFEERAKSRVVRAMTLTEAATVLQSHFRWGSRSPRRDRASCDHSKAARDLHSQPSLGDGRLAAEAVVTREVGSVPPNASEVLGPQYAMLSAGGMLLGGMTRLPSAAAELAPVRLVGQTRTPVKRPDRRAADAQSRLSTEEVVGGEDEDAQTWV